MRGVTKGEDEVYAGRSRCYWVIAVHRYPTRRDLDTYGQIVFNTWAVLVDETKRYSYPSVSMSGFIFLVALLCQWKVTHARNPNSDRAP